VVASHVKGVRHVEIALETQDAGKGQSLAEGSIHEAAWSSRRHEIVVEHLILPLKRSAANKRKSIAPSPAMAMPL
jgi:hypothetical protein